VHLQTRSITASKCIFQFTRPWSPSAYPNKLDHGLQVYHQGASVGVEIFRGNSGGMSDAEYMFGRPRGRYTASHFHLIFSYKENAHSIFPNFWSHSLFPRFFGSTQLRGSSQLGSIISSLLLSTLLELNVEGTRGEIFTESLIAFQSRCKRVPNEPIPMYGHSWPQRQSVCLKQETDRARGNGETVIGG